jgi:hypothetical protein
MARFLTARLFAVTIAAGTLAACSGTKLTTPTPPDLLVVQSAASISGQVQDGAGAALAGVALALTNGTSEMDAVSDDAGSFVFNNVGDGAWMLTCTKDGYAPASQPVQVTSGNNQKLVIALAAGDDLRPRPLPQPLPIKR